MRPLRTCPVCGGADLEPFAMSSWRPGQLHLAQAQCRGCGLLAAQPQATEEELGAYYAAQYYQQHPLTGDAHWKENVRDYPLYEIPLMERLWAGFAPRAGASVAEIGCGRGSLLTVLGERGYRVRGCEVSPEAVAFCRSKGLDVIEGRDFGDARAACDVAASFQVIEHVLDPRAFVRTMVELVKPGGVVVITTENVWTAQHRLERFWAQLHGRPGPYRTSSEHTFVFEAQHLTRLLREEGCDEARAQPYRRAPATGSLHFRVYLETLRAIDARTKSGEYLMAVARRGR